MFNNAGSSSDAYIAWNDRLTVNNELGVNEKETLMAAATVYAWIG